jgi:hypothetical protein
MTDTVVADTTISEVYIEEEVEDDVSAEEHVENVTIPQYIPRVVAADTLAAWRQEKSHAYMDYIDSVLRARQMATEQAPETHGATTNFSLSPLLRFLFWVAGISTIAFLLIRLFAGNTRLFFTNKKMVDNAAVTEQEELDALGYAAQAQRAAQTGNYRSATRYQFLETLRILGEAGHLQLAAQKTNMQYLAELQGKPYTNQFARLALLYEYVWYGSFVLTQDQYQQFSQEYESFCSQIRT